MPDLKTGMTSLIANDDETTFNVIVVGRGPTSLGAAAGASALVARPSCWKDILSWGVLALLPCGCRGTASCSMMGHAAGTATALSAKNNVPLREVEPDEIHRVLRDSGVSI